MSARCRSGVEASDEGEPKVPKRRRGSDSAGDDSRALPQQAASQGCRVRDRCHIRTSRGSLSLNENITELAAEVDVLLVLLRVWFANSRQWDLQAQRAQYDEIWGMVDRISQL